MDNAEAEQIFKDLRQFFKELLDHLYVQAAEAGRYPSPERMIRDQLLPLVEVAILSDQPPQPHTDVTDLQAVIGVRLFRRLHHDAVDAYFRHRPELKIKGTPGPKPNMELVARIKGFVAEGKSSEQIRQILEAEGVNLSLSGVQSYRKSRYGKTRGKKPQR